ncbi:MAG: type VI secretion system tip protein TssI/VgrG [Nannocystaceae bacterium]
MATTNAAHNDAHQTDDGGVLPPVVFSFTTYDGLEANDWKVRAFELREEISKPYHLELEVIAADPEVEVASLIGGRCELALDRGQGVRLIPGIIHSATGVARGHHRLGIKLTIVPALALLAHRRSRRIFNDKSVPEVVELVIGDVLARHGRDYEFTLDPASYVRRPSITQHDETDLEFLERLLADEGIHYYFVADGARERVVFTDPAQQAHALSFDDDQGALPVVVHGAGSTPREGVSDFAFQRTLTPESSASRYWNHLEADQPPREEARGDVDDPAALALHDVTAPNPSDPDVAARRSRLALEAAQTFAQRGEGESDAIFLAPGYLFQISGHVERACDRGYLLTAVTHLGDAPDIQTHADADAGPRYSNTFVCIPDTTPYRPTRPTGAMTPIGPQTAIVVGPEGEEIHCDEHGRVLVCFAWDRRAPAEAMTCWARVAQEWAGPGFGSQFIPRIGTEVLVCFLHDDADQPVITKCLYNSQNPYPFALPAKKAQSGIRSDSTPGGGGCNEIILDDTKGHEEVQINAHRNMSLSAGNDYTRRVGGNQTITIRRNLDQTITADHIRKVEGQETVIVDGERSVSVNGGIRNVATGGNIAIDCERGQLTLHGATFLEAKTEGDLRMSAEGSASATAGANVFLWAKTGAATLLGKHAVMARSEEGNATLQGKLDVTVQSSHGAASVMAKGLLALESKSARIDMAAPEGISAATTSGSIDLTAGRDIVLNAASSITLKVGLSSITLTPQGIVVSAPSITSTATGIHTVSGSLIRLN